MLIPMKHSINTTQTPGYPSPSPARDAYLLRAQVIKIISKAKTNPNPRIMPYPNPWGRGATNLASSAITEDSQAQSKVNQSTSLTKAL
jgi:hypothetical protein